MAKLQIIPTATSLALTGNRGDLALTVTGSGSAEEYTFSIVTKDQKSAAWVHLKGATQRTIAAGGVETLIVSVNAADAKVQVDESHSFFVRAVSVRDPDENWVDSQSISYSITGQKTKLPIKWIVLAIAACVVLAGIIVAVTQVIASSKKPDSRTLGQPCVDRCDGNLVCRANVCTYHFANLEKLWRLERTCDNYFEGADTPASIRRLICTFATQDHSKIIAPASFRIFENPTWLGLESSKAFNHYNPGFVAWLGDYGVPGADNPVLRAATQPAYDEHVRSVARILYFSKRAYDENPDKALFTESYNHHLRGEMGFTAYQYFQSMDAHRERPLVPRGITEIHEPHFRIAGMFWVRRAMDNTGELFFTALKKVLNTYDKVWFDEAEKTLVVEMPSRARQWFTPN
jgi:hypothetical protein